MTATLCAKSARRRPSRSRKVGALLSGAAQCAVLGAQLRGARLCAPLHRRQLIDAAPPRAGPLVPRRAWVATVRGTYPTPEAGTRTQYVLYVGPWGQAALRLRYVHNAGGWYA